ncbi:hypothetical protein [Azospirillum sp. TSO22-1]|uniref:hypothetical protein n=1 Tax=Azospirillum sp. TSO22-1 TaxID=716789 RepID=UPI000D620C89|nr:hypothetical protein [Azospirillum sp. TSO22-1]PWC43521.1 hypothetical protein TSO221_19360 [Azospirillum sp. TSO22-1]
MTAPDGFPMDALDRRSDVHRASVVDAFAAAGVSLPVRGVLHSISCPAVFRTAVLDLAARRGCDAAALAGAALLLGAGTEPDPGAGDAVLDLRLDTVHDHGAIRRALATALAAADGWKLVPSAEASRLEGRLETLEYRNKALASALERVSFQPLEGGLTQVRDAASLFGFVNEWCFDEDRVVRRFRELAPVYHPDTGMVGCRQRMAQLIEARNLLIKHVRTAYRSGDWTARR